MYDVDITRGRSQINDKIFDYLTDRLFDLDPKSWTDLGCNSGELLKAFPNGIGVDNSSILVEKCLKSHLNAIECGVESTPFKDEQFDVAVLSCVLEQIQDWEKALNEAIRISKKVIGINPIPNGSQWGQIGGWVKSVIDPFDMIEKYNADITYPDIEGKYYFEIGT